MTSDKEEAGRRTRRVAGIRSLSKTAFVLQIERGGAVFTPGQCLLIGLPGDRERREYSIYSGVRDEHLEVLVREVEDGVVSRKLRKLRAGARLSVDGPVGFFTLDERKLRRRRHLFIASGTGIAPFHSMAHSYEGLDYRIIHGVRESAEAFERESYPAGRYLCCATRDAGGEFHGRVTAWLQQNPVEKDTFCYLCGNVKMIDEAFDILTAQGLPAGQIHAEVYF